MAKLINYGDKKMTIPNADEKDRIINELSDCEYIVTQIEKREKRKNPYPLLPPVPCSRKVQNG